jgi:hypothetical protein
MHFFWFFVLMCLAGLAFTWIEPILALPVYGAHFLSLKLWNRLLSPLIVIGLLWQAYVLLAWCLLALSLTRLFMGNHAWLYYAVGFIACIAPIQFMASHNLMHGNPQPDAFGDYKNFGIVLFTALGFILFAVLPVLATPWLWLFRLGGSLLESKAWHGIAWCLSWAIVLLVAGVVW